VVFPGDQDDERVDLRRQAADQYYLHRFYRAPARSQRRQPSAVRDEIEKVIGFWLAARRLSGFRVDAVPFFLETREPIADD
jgi:glycosidase